MKKHIIIGVGLTVLIALLAILSVIRDPSDQLRPQAIRQMQQELSKPPPKLPPEIPEPQKIVDDIRTKIFQQPDIAGATNEAQKQVTEQEIN